MRIVAGLVASCSLIASSADPFMHINGGVHHGGTTCGWRFSSRSSSTLYLRSRMPENLSRGLCASRFRLVLPWSLPDAAMSSCSGEVLMRTVASSAVCSSCCCTGSRCASTSTAAPTVVQNAPVIIWAARLWIFLMAFIILLPRLVKPLPGIYHAEHP